MANWWENQKNNTDTSSQWWNTPDNQQFVNDFWKQDEEKKKKQQGVDYEKQLAQQTQEQNKVQEKQGGTLLQKGFNLVNKVVNSVTGYLQEKGWVSKPVTNETSQDTTNTATTGDEYTPEGVVALTSEVLKKNTNDQIASLSTLQSQLENLSKDRTVYLSEKRAEAQKNGTEFNATQLLQDRENQIKQIAKDIGYFYKQNIPESDWDKITVSDAQVDGMLTQVKNSISDAQRNITLNDEITGKVSVDKNILHALVNSMKDKTALPSLLKGGKEVQDYDYYQSAVKKLSESNGDYNTAYSSLTLGEKNALIKKQNQDWEEGINRGLPAEAVNWIAGSFSLGLDLMIANTLSGGNKVLGNAIDTGLTGVSKTALRAKENTDDQYAYSPVENKDGSIAFVFSKTSTGATDKTKGIASAVIGQYVSDTIEQGYGELIDGLTGKVGKGVIQSNAVKKIMQSEGGKKLGESFVGQTVSKTVDFFTKNPAGAKILKLAGVSSVFGEINETLAGDITDSITSGQEYTLSSDYLKDAIVSTALVTFVQSGSANVAGAVINKSTAKSFVNEVNNNKTDYGIPENAELTEDKKIINTETGEDITDQVLSTQGEQTTTTPTDTTTDTTGGNVTTTEVPETLKTEASKYDSAQAFVSAYQEKTASLANAFDQSTDGSVTQEAQDLNNAFTEYTNNEQIQSQYAQGKTDTDVLKEIYNTVKGVQTEVKQQGEQINTMQEANKVSDLENQTKLQKTDQAYILEEKGFNKVDNAQPVTINKNIDTFIHQDPQSGEYDVVEGRSGRRIGSGATQKEAVDNAIAVIKKIGVSGFNAKIDQAVQKNGVSPRYTQPTEKVLIRDTTKQQEKKSLQQESFEKSGLQKGQKIFLKGKLREISDYSRSISDSHGTMVKFKDGSYTTLDNAIKASQQKQTEKAKASERTQNIKNAKENVAKTEQQIKEEENKISKRRMDIGKTNKDVKAINDEIRKLQASDTYKNNKDEYMMLVKEARLAHQSLEEYFDSMIRINGVNAEDYINDVMIRYKANETAIQMLLAKRNQVINDQLRAEGFSIPKYRQVQDRVEKDIVVIRNMSEDGVKDVLKSGGMPVPSIAITKYNIPFEDFGEISFIGDSKLVNPSNKLNKIYSGDAWTPRVPTPEYDFKNFRRVLSESEQAFLAKVDVLPMLTDVSNVEDAKYRASKIESEKDRNKAMELISKVIGEPLIRIKNKEPQGLLGKIFDNNSYIRKLWKASEDYNDFELTATNDDRGYRVLEKYAKGYEDGLDGIEFFKELENEYNITKPFYNADALTEKILEGVNVAKDVRASLPWATLQGQAVKQFTSLKEIIEDSKKLSVKPDIKDQLDTATEDIETDRVYKSLSEKDSKAFKYIFGDIQGYDYLMTEMVASRNVTPTFFRNFLNEQLYLTDENKGLKDGLIQKFVSKVDFVKLNEELDRKYWSPPTDIFEAKILRNVKIGEWNGAIVPTTLSKEVKDQLQSVGGKDFKIVEYNPEDKEGRQKALEEFKDYRFKLQDEYAQETGKKISKSDLEEILKMNKKYFGDDNVRVFDKLMTQEGQKLYGRYFAGWVDILNNKAEFKNTYYHEAGHKAFELFTLKDSVGAMKALNEVIKDKGEDYLRAKWGNYKANTIAKYLYENARRAGMRGYDEITSMADIDRNLAILTRDQKAQVKAEIAKMQIADSKVLLSRSEFNALNKLDQADYKNYLYPKLKEIQDRGLQNGEVVVIRSGDGNWADTDVQVALNRGVNAKTTVGIANESDLVSTGNSAKDARGERFLINDLLARYRGAENYGEDIYTLAEEELVENFYSYKISRDSAKGTIKGFFSNLWDFMKSLVNAGSTVRKFYKNLYDGKFSATRINNIQYQYQPKYRAESLFDDEIAPPKDTTFKIPTTPKDGVVYDTSGRSKTQELMLQKEIEQTLKDGFSTPATRAVTAFKPVMDTKGVEQDSQAFKKISSRYQELIEQDPEMEQLKYKKMNIADVTAKAINFVENYPEEARRITMGSELAPEGTTNIAVSLAYTEKMYEQGNWKKALEADRALSYRGTRFGQEIVSFRGRLNGNSPSYFIDAVLDARRLDAGKREFKSKNMKEYETAKESRVQKLAKTLTDIKIEQADDFINKLIC